MAKRYGLIVPTPSFNASKNVFGDGDSDSDVEKPPSAVRFGAGEKLQRQARAVQEKFQAEDPTVYQYDELYDTMEKVKSEKATRKKADKKPKYIERLLRTAEERKKENERRVEREVQKEREAEGDKFADKESFVTSSYKKKLEEMKLEEEKEARRKYLEDMCDVTKQADLGGFYRHLYDQQLNSKEDKDDNNDDNEKGKKATSDNDTDDASKTKNESKDKTKRSYRKRKHTDNENREKSDSEDETAAGVRDIKTVKSEGTHLPSNIDADSDFSIDDSSSDDENNDKAEKDAEKTEVTKEPEVEFKVPNGAAPVAVKSSEIKQEENEQETTEVKEDAKKPKIDIWKKRTVGEVFEGALQRYYERKSRRI